MRRYSFVFALILLFSLFLANPASANEMGFSVQAILPENQVTAEHSYFDLKMTPGQVQTIQVALTNDTEREIEVAMAANAAITNGNGVVEYSQENPTLDPTLNTSFSEIAHVEPTIILPPKAVKVVDIQLKMPVESYDGVILGGLYFIEKNNPENPAQATNVQIDNHFSYTVGVLLTETETKVHPNLILNQVSASQTLGRNVILANLQNPEAAMLSNLRIEAKVYQGKEETPLYEQVTDELRMAPNSNFDYTIDMNEAFFEPGDYRVEIVAISNGKTWQLEKEFNIQAKDAKAYNDQTAYQDKRPKIDLMPYFIGGGIILVLFVGGAFWLGKRSNKTTKND
ncbi:DUF916 and DUF3324 domain-containing protein [Isobaculum melis]|uniref:Uncharacterized protein n=1 Tax=Isobaculum melis TaxID=142588 RepID=A0A1H9PWM6_9LACT|nr:DUF916 and DUF3324 domain-containing protein [Isobaculum melis]SER52631.1 protein of unknown function [Isobaculum melis]